MTAAAKPSFKSIDFGKLSETVDELAAERGVPTMVFPVKAEEPAKAPVAVPLKAPAPRKPVERRRAAQMRRIAVELPGYQVKKLFDRAHEDGATVRFVIAKALHDAGFELDEADLSEDRRRDR